jgi:hypothetical protein
VKIGLKNGLEVPKMGSETINLNLSEKEENCKKVYKNNRT